MTYNQVLNKLSRVTQSSAIIPEIDGLRFLAIVPVVLLHLSTNYIRTNPIGLTTKSLLENDFFFQILYKGSYGVNIFFVISGFVLALPFASNYKAVKLNNYYVRRLTRLEPPFILSLSLFFVALLITGTYANDVLIKSFFASLGYVHYFVFGAWSLINPISWSLETEVQFYVLAPLLFTVFFIKDWRLRLALGIFFSVASSLIVYVNHDAIVNLHLAKSLLVYFPYFLTGIFLADLFIRNRVFFETKSFGWDFLGLAAFIGIYTFHHDYAAYSTLAECICIMGVFGTAFKGKLFNVFFTRKEIVVIGGMCYSIYLLHYGMIYFLMKFTSDLFWSNSFLINYCIQASLLLPLILILSSLFFVFFEKPFMYKDWYKKFPSNYFSRLGT